MGCEGSDRRRQHRDAAIRMPHGQRSRGVKVVKNRKGRQEIILLTLAWLGFFVPLVCVASPAFSFAEYPLRPNPLIAGVVCLVVGLWLFYRSHADLGTNWSVTLEVRGNHQLITNGGDRSFRRRRHSRTSVAEYSQRMSPTRALSSGSRISSRTASSTSNPASGNCLSGRHAGA